MGDATKEAEWGGALTDNALTPGLVVARLSPESGKRAAQREA